MTDRAPPKPSKDLLTVLDLFSGIGGFSLGLERTGGFRTIAFCETDPFCRRVLAKHWPDVPIIEDVRTDEFPRADVIVGGFPCQDISVAGRRAGLSGERSGLYRELVRAVRLVRPEYVLVENVAELLGNGMGTVLGDLAEGGNCVEWDCVSASAVGAPHQRDRVWIVAHAKSADDWSGDRGETERQVSEPRNDPGQKTTPNPESVGCGSGRSGRPPDSFAWVRDATRRNFADADGSRLAQRESVEIEAPPQLSSTKRTTSVYEWQRGWPCEPALLGMDDGVPDRVDRTRSLGNTLLPQIPELIGRAILAERAGMNDEMRRRLSNG